MKDISRLSRFSRTRVIVISFIVVCFIALCISPPRQFDPAAEAATPTGGTLTNASGPITYTAGPFLIANATAQANGEPICSPATPCDDFTLTVNISPNPNPAKKIKIQIQWPVATADFDVYILDASSNVIATAASSADPEVALIPALNGTYTIRVVPFAPAAQSITGTISLESVPAAPPPASGTAPRYKNYPAPTDLPGAESAGEPSIGVDWLPRVASLKHDKVNTGGVAFFTANLNEFRVNFDDCSSPAHALWEDVTFPTASATTLDPIGYVDFRTGRVFQDQLAGASSILVYSDTDGNSWTQSAGPGEPHGVDHQTLGGGPYNESAVPPPVHPLYSDAVYYCSQDAATALCSRSDDGGQTFGPAIPVYLLTQCGGLHGHVKVAPDGTVYVPNKSCGSGQGVAVSTDNGQTWTIRTVPGSSAGDTDPSVGVGSDSTVYLGYQNGDGRPHIARSTDRGLNWLDRDVSQGIINNVVFPEVVAGDGDRAAFGFLGTPDGGNYQDAANFKGIWHFYIATTYDRGNTYILVDATPTDPVQVGSICTSGTTCGADRNLLDFNDISVDKEGRVLAAYADGCVAPSCNSNSQPSASRSALATIIRQSGGRRLFATFDPPEPAVPAAPRLISAIRDVSGVTVSWEEPDNGGSPITGYKIYRGTTSGGETLLTTIGPSATKYLDATADPAQQYFYRVTAVNVVGEGPFCGEVSVTAAPPPPNPCNGVTILTDPTGDIVVPVGVTASPGWDLQSLSLSEPFGIGSGKIVLTLKVVSLSTVPPNTTWPIKFHAPNGTNYVAQMRTTTGTDINFEYGPDGGTLSPADPASSYSSDGTIKIVVPSSGIGNPLPGQKLNQFLVRVSVNAVAISFTPDNMPDSLAPSGEYTLVGNDFCRPNNAPIAVLTANPKTGDAPLTVNFNGSGSNDPDTSAPPDTIASYTFNFGDGSPVVTQSSPTISHTYNSAGDYRATLKVTDSRGKVSDNTAGVNIEVETPPAISINDVTVTEGNAGTTNATFTVTLSAASTSAVTVKYDTGNGTALAGSDYQAASGTLSFAPGDTSKTIVIAVNGDTTAEADETFAVNLSNPTSATIADGQGIGTINNDDSPPTISINDVAATEGDAGTTNATFTATLSAPSALAVTVKYDTADGTALAGSDYQSGTGTLTFAPGETSKTITVVVNADTAFEPDETFFVNLSNPTNATIADGQAIGTIKNDDQPPPSVQLSAAAYTVAEDAGHFSITVTRINTSSAATIDYATSDTSGLAECATVSGKASQRCDYTIAFGTLRFAAGESSKTVTIPVINDVYAEGSESFTFTLSHPSGTALGGQSAATLTITDNDSNSSAPNPIDVTDFFVLQHYLDFLNREPDPGGFKGWQDILNNCASGDTRCDRIEVSSSFFRSPEFQERGYFVYRFYSASFGRKPNYAEFMPDLSRVSGFLTEAEKEANKVAFVDELMSRQEFKNKYDSTINNPTAYVDTLLSAAGLPNHPSRAGWIDGLNKGTLTRAKVLRELAESSEVQQKFFNEAFVVMQYFGYLRRDPDSLYLNWIKTMNDNGGNYRIMVNGFLNSQEYRARFGHP